jgi:hypothetical protein
MNSTLLPRLTAYLAQLPRGFDSFPDCRAKADLFDSAAQEFPQILECGELPDPIYSYLTAEKYTGWIPETLAVALNLVIRDLCFKTDADFFAWVRTLNEQIFNRPTYRALIALLSTQLLVMGAAKRWAAFHQGTTLGPKKSVEKGGRRIVEATLSFPPKLFNEFAVRVYCEAYLTAARVSHAEDPQIELYDVGEENASFLLSWRA